MSQPHATGLTVFTFLSPVFGVMLGGILPGELTTPGLILVNDEFRRRVR
jgi:hypothetical protein